MSKELIDRLRADRFEFNGDLDLEAADLIEQQQSWIASLEQNARDADRMYKELETELAEQQKRIDDLRRELAALKSGFDAERKVADKSEREAFDLGRKLAASQAQNRVLRDALDFVLNGSTELDQRASIDKARKALAQPTDDSALRELLKAERERCAKVCDRKKKEFAEAFKDMADESIGAGQCAAAIRAMEDQ